MKELIYMSQHTSLAETSLCTGKALRTYFLDNTLPENGVECEISEQLFPEDEGSTLWTEEDESGEDKKLRDILREIGIAADGDLKKFQTSMRLKPLARGLYNCLRGVSWALGCSDFERWPFQLGLLNYDSEVWL
jgi:hypothetical protein